MYTYIYLQFTHTYTFCKGPKNFSLKKDVPVSKENSKIVLEENGFDGRFLSCRLE
jgi:hypothetical protein